MNQRRAGLLATILIGVLLVSSLVSYVNAAGAGQNDAGQNRDASDSKVNAATIHVGRWQGQLVTTTDTTDWYKFAPTNSAGRNETEIVLQSLTGNNNLILELHEAPAEAATVPIATGVGGNGAWAIERSLAAGTYWLRVALASGATTGRYEIAIAYHPENDGGQKKDAGTTAATSVSLGSVQSGQMRLVEGNLTPADTQDSYSFGIPDGDSQVIAGIHFGPTATLSASITPSSGISALPSTQRSGPGFVTSYQPQARSTISGTWLLAVTRSGSAVDQEVPYTITLVVRPATPDPGQPGNDPDAPGDTLGSDPITQGIHRGRLDPGAGEIRDVYKLPGIAAGQVIHVGASSHQTDTDQRPIIGLILYRPGGIEVARVSPCRAAAGITMSAANAGDWYVEVFDQSDGTGGCGSMVIGNNGEYALSYRVQIQRENGAADAPAGNDNSPAVTSPADVFAETWLDSTDISDTYTLGNLVAGQGVRVGATTDVPTMEYSIHLYRNSTLIATGSSASGTGRINSAVGVNGTYFVRFDYRMPEGQLNLPTGYIHFYASIVQNEPPTAVTLSEINRPATGGGDVTRTSVTLHWSRSVDDDFARYEVHAGVNLGYTPSSGTLKQTITNRETVTTTVSGLRSDTTYEFVIRVVDQSGHLADSNRRTTTTRSGPLSNTAPTLDGGGVTPASGSTSTIFKFQVNYTDADNDPPTRAQVEISGVRSNMVAQGTNYAEGVLFVFETSFATTGTRNFFFDFSDGQTGGDARDPTGAGAYTGPTVAQAGNRPPSADATANRTDGDAPMDVRFDVTASDPDGDALTYSWDFDTSNGIQTDSSSKSPRHTYTRRGVYTAAVYVRDARGAESSDSITINVRGSANEPPTVAATATPSEGQAPLTVKFNANAQDADGTIASYKWDFDDSNGISQDSTEAAPTHTYTKAGSFVARVWVKDNGSAETLDTVMVVVRTGENSPPSIVVTADPVEGSAPLLVNFTAAATDPDGDAITIRWDFNASSGGTDTDATGSVASHTYTSAGEFTAMAIATDSKGATATSTTIIRVLGGGSGSVFIIAHPSTGRAPLAVAFRADTSELVTPPASYAWSFGDNTSNGTGESITHTYEKPGSYTAVLVVTDEAGGQYESTITIRVQGGRSPGLGAAFAIVFVFAVAFLLQRRQGPK